MADQFRATVKGSTNVNNQRPILTGMALGLNSTLSISEGNTKLPSCPILLLSNSEGLLQVYYFFQQNLPSMYQTPVVIKPIQAPPLTPVEPFFPSGKFFSFSCLITCLLFIYSYPIFVSFGGECRENNNNNLFDEHDHH